MADTLPTLTKEISQRKIDVYSGVKPHSIHTDEAWARKKGFKAPLAQAMMSTAYVSELMTRFLGAGFVKGACEVSRDQKLDQGVGRIRQTPTKRALAALCLAHGEPPRSTRN